MASTNFKELVARINSLKAQFLPATNPIAAYTVQEEDQMRAFRLLVHAEIEVYLESICTLLVADLERELTAPQSNGGAIHVWANNAVQACRRAISENNGVRGADVKKMFGAIGLSEADFESISPLFLERMTTFGKRRGDVAHQSAMRATYSIIPQREAGMVDELVEYLRSLDIKVSSIRLQNFLS